MSELRPMSDVAERLKSLGMYKGLITERLTNELVAAVRAFQRVNGLKVDGIPGKYTQQALWPVLPERDAPAEGTGNKFAVWPRQRDVRTFYGDMGDNLVRLELPYTMRLAWMKTTRIHSFLIHARVHDSAKRCLDRMVAELGMNLIRDLGLDLFGGCIADPPRRMRGGSSWSMHSWAIAIDFDPARNQLKWNHNLARLAQPDAEPFWKIWEDEGWVSLGRTRDLDWMHVQAARL